jgi:hypothetical protein
MKNNKNRFFHAFTLAAAFDIIERATKVGYYVVISHDYDSNVLESFLAHMGRHESNNKVWLAN